MDDNEMTIFRAAKIEFKHIYTQICSMLECVESVVRAQTAPTPADQTLIGGLMAHLETSLTAIGFLDPSNPDRVLRKLRRLLGRAGVTENEVAILRGMCRQIDWAAKHLPSQVRGGRGDGKR